MIRLCFVTPFGHRLGGSDEVLLTLLRHLDRTRFEALVVLLEPGDFAGEIRDLGIRTLTLPGGRLRNPAHVFRTMAKLGRLLRRERPDLIVNWLSTAHLYAGPASLVAGMANRCVWWQHDLHGARIPERARGRDRIGTYRGRVLDQLATTIPASAVGCISEAVRFEQSSRRPRRHSFVILNGIDEPTPVPGEDVHRLRREMGIPKDTTVVGLVGRLFAWKGHHLLLQALAEVMFGRKDVFGLFVGGGGHRANVGYTAYVARLTRDLGIEDRVLFTGQVANTVPYMQAMDILVSASAPEPFGLVLLEAMALEVPVIAVDAGGPTEIIVNGESGLLVPSNRPEDLVPAIQALVSEPGWRRQLAVAGRAHYLERFTGERMTRDIERQLEALTQ